MASKPCAPPSASAGTGWRQVELFSENVNLLASSRDVRFTGDIGPEEAFTWGVDHTVQLTKGRVRGTINLDFYQTRFQRQFFPDYDTDPTLAIIGEANRTAAVVGFQRASWSLTNAWTCSRVLLAAIVGMPVASR